MSWFALPVAAVLVLVVVFATRALGRAAAPPERSPGPQREKAGAEWGLEGLVVSVTRISRRTVGVDCLVRGNHAGWDANRYPIHLRASGPMMLWCGSLPDVLSRWVMDSDQVSVSIRKSRSKATATFEKGSSRLILDVDNALELRYTVLGHLSSR